MKNIVQIAMVVVIVLLMVIGTAMIWIAEFDAKDAEIARLTKIENGLPGILSEVKRARKNAKLFTDKWNGKVRRLSDEKAALKSEIAKWEACTAKRNAEPNEPEPNEPPAFTDLVQESLKGVVHIMCPQWQGSGFVIDKNTIGTARHVNEGVEDFLITTNDGCKVRATRAISMKDYDVSFIRIDDLTCVSEYGEHSLKFRRDNLFLGGHGVTLTPLPLGSIKDCVLGQSVYVIGSPFGKVNFNSLTTGIMSGVDVDWSPLGDDYGWEVAFTVDSAGHPGNSGCPVFTTDGVVRGILVGGFSPVLISVMPCDLFLSDLDSIRLMFTQDRYRKEEASADMGEYYNVRADNEYY